MNRRKSKLNDVSAQLVEYLVVRRGMSQNEIAEMIEVDKSFISRVRQAEREFSPNQMNRIAEKLGIPMGAMLLDARPPKKPATGETKQIIELCEKLMLQADAALATMREKKAS